jgi:hypothetical protein
MRFAQTVLFLSLLFAFSSNVIAETYDQPPYWTGERVTAERKMFEGRYEKTMTNSSWLIENLSAEMKPCDQELWKKIGITLGNYDRFQQRLTILLDDDPIWEREQQYLETLLIEMTVNVDRVKMLLKDYTGRADLIGVRNLCKERGEDVVIKRPRAELEHPIETFLEPNNQELVLPKVPLRAIER